MDPSILVNGVLRSVLGGRRKKSKKALRYLTGRGGSMLSNPTTLLTAAGVAWGIFETLQNRGPGAGQGAGGGFGGLAGGGSQWGDIGGTAPQPAVSTPPAPPAQVPLPPLPNIGGAPAAAPAVDEEALRLIRLAIAAAHADGAMNEHERAAVLQQAAANGVAEVVERELRQVRPLAEIVAGITDPAQRATLYVLAFTIARADEQLTGAERIYLAQLAHLLGFDAAEAQQLEEDAGERIEALGDQGQLGG